MVYTQKPMNKEMVGLVPLVAPACLHLSPTLLISTEVECYLGTFTDLCCRRVKMLNSDVESEGQHSISRVVMCSIDSAQRHRAASSIT